MRFRQNVRQASNNGRQMTPEGLAWNAAQAQETCCVRDMPERKHASPLATPQPLACDEHVKPDAAGQLWPGTRQQCHDVGCRRAFDELRWFRTAWRWLCMMPYIRVLQARRGAMEGRGWWWDSSTCQDRPPGPTSPGLEPWNLGRGAWRRTRGLLQGLIHAKHLLHSSSRWTVCTHRCQDCGSSTGSCAPCIAQCTVRSCCISR
ncbi:hypothetical protein T440DRAFT_182084 [Plenodomus tracheiphilus IPT5]|uniref:Uncharacterized protein n=1 Tax=Plenodomus tracheiphilus IPT5 TaxID=1408161 RepID=A0A6A7B0T8_9PLEO|nr:hypothetical protein T440DRAFT_182084 [Plenodomus tracheiphilus IPT5]